MTHQQETMRENNRLVRRFLHALGRAGDDPDGLEALLTSDHVQHGPSLHQVLDGRAASTEGLGSLARAFPDLDIKVQGQFASADRVAATYEATGTQTGDLVLGDSVFAPTGRTATWRDVVYVRIADGKIAETWLQTRKADILGQLGLDFSDATPRMEPAPVA